MENPGSCIMKVYVYVLQENDYETEPNSIHATLESAQNVTVEDVHYEGTGKLVDHANADGWYHPTTEDRHWYLRTDHYGNWCIEEWEVRP